MTDVLISVTDVLIPLTDVLISVTGVLIPLTDVLILVTGVLSVPFLLIYVSDRCVDIYQ